MKEDAALDTAAMIAVCAASLDRASIWEEVRVDADKLLEFNPSVVMVGPLWSGVAPRWHETAWVELRALLRSGKCDVWVDWYEQRLLGGTRGENSELLFAGMPTAIWDLGLAATSSWIAGHLPPHRNLEQPPEADMNVGTLAWLKAHPKEIGNAIALRAALRVAPLAARVARKGLSEANRRELETLASAIFRAVALARAYGTLLLEPRDIAEAVDAASGAAFSSVKGDTPQAATFAAAAAANAVAVASGGNPLARVEAAIRMGVGAFASADASAFDAETNAWAQIRIDAEHARKHGARTLANTPLWSNGRPRWSELALEVLREALPDGEDWEVWFEWYEDRLRGVSRGEAYELVFATVPLDVWENGPAAGNAWIKEHLPKERKDSDLPGPVLGVEAPFTYAWNEALRVAVVAGSQNLPSYPFFSSEEDHQKTLQVCRIEAERLRKALKQSRYNVRPEYAERLDYYLEDLPTQPGTGNILLAYDQIRVLHAMFAQDVDVLPQPFAAALAQVISNQFALNGFYELVQRHEEAVNTAKWTEPFPLQAARDFFAVVDKNTPKLFESEVSQGLHRVEQAAALVALPAEAVSETSTAIKPPSLPAGTSDVQRSRIRQIAASANSVYAEFLKGKDLLPAIHGWSHVAHELGQHVGPVLDFLKSLGPS
jgi:hypothetical protein